jgi:hypothetical protein
MSQIFYSTTPHVISEGSKIYFASDKKPYTVKALSNRYAVCTKPFNPKKTVLYTIIDFSQQIRGRENLIFCMGFETETDCKEALLRLESGESEVSHRHRVPLDIVKIVLPNSEQKLQESDTSKAKSISEPLANNHGEEAAT